MKGLQLCDPSHDLFTHADFCLSLRSPLWWADGCPLHIPVMPTTPSFCLVYSLVCSGEDMYCALHKWAAIGFQRCTRKYRPRQKGDGTSLRAKSPLEGIIWYYSGW